LVGEAANSHSVSGSIVPPWPARLRPTAAITLKAGERRRRATVASGAPEDVAVVSIQAMLGVDAAALAQPSVRASNVAGR
jgi:hypothetical protein